MSETICPQCSTSSPEQALYCQACSQPLVCRNCQAPLLLTARACIRCGLLISERSHLTVQTTSVPSGYSRFKIHETPDIREIDFIFTNEAMEHVRDLFPLLFSHRPLPGRDKNGKNHLIERTEDVNAANAEFSSSGTNYHSNGQFRNSESQVRFRSAHVRLVPLGQAQPLHEGDYQAEATDVVETFSEYSTSQTKSALEVKTLAEVSSPQAKAVDVEETLSPVSPFPQPHVAAELDHVAAGLDPAESKPLTNALKWQVATVVAIGMALSVMDNTIISVTLPQMQNAFQTNFETITWVATIYFLTQAAVIPIVGYLSDRIGSKLVFLGALALFIISSVLCALSPTKEALIAFRGLQGIGGGALIPVGIAILFRIFPPNERGKASAVAGIPILMAPALGPSLGGYLSTAFSWEAIFVINIPIGIVALVLALFILPGRVFGRDEQMSIQTAIERQRFDILGFLLSMAGFTILVYGISEAASKGWSDQTVLTSLLVGAVLLIALVVVELKVPDPVMDLRLFKNYTFNIANLLMMISAAVFYGSLFLLPFFFENVQGNTSLTTGTFLIGQGVGTAVGVAISGMLYNRVGPRILTALGLLVLAGGTYMLTQIDINTTGEELQVSLALRGLGAGFFIIHLQTLALSLVSNRAMAKASSLLGILRQVATALGVTGLTTYLAQQATTHATDLTNVLLEGQKTHQLSGVAATCAQAGGPTQNLAAIKACVVQHATITGLTDTFWIALLLPAACILLALILGRDPAVEAHKKARDNS